jgi:hypothetical protein
MMNQALLRQTKLLHHQKTTRLIMFHKISPASRRESDDAPVTIIASIKDRATEALRFNFGSIGSDKKMSITTNLTDHTGNDGVGYTTRVGLIFGSSTNSVVHESCKSREWSKNQSEFS